MGDLTPGRAYLPPNGVCLPSGVNLIICQVPSGAVTA